MALCADRDLLPYFESILLGIIKNKEANAKKEQQPLAVLVVGQTFSLTLVSSLQFSHIRFVFGDDEKAVVDFLINRVGHTRIFPFLLADGTKKRRRGVFVTSPQGDQMSFNVKYTCFCT